MSKRLFVIRCFLGSIILLFAQIAMAAPHDFDGKWNLIKEKSTEIDLYGALSIEFQIVDDQLRLVQQWGIGRSFRDSILLNIDGSFHGLEIRDRVVASNVFMGLSMPVGEQRQIKATWETPGAVLNLVEQFTLISSQGRFPETVTHRYSLSADKEIITYDVHRASRKTGPNVRYVLKKDGLKNAYYMELEDNWEINGKLSTQAFLISLQGLANATGPNLYFVYPSTWDFRFTPTVLDFLKNERNYTFNKLTTAEQSLQIFKENVKGYVVWDKEVRTSLIVSFTVAGLEQAVVVSDEMIPLVEKFGLKKVEDFRGKFTGQSDVQIYTWAYEQYWQRCSKEYIVWMGGEHGAIMKPGVADWGIFKRAFFNDLSTKVTDTEEYALANKLLSEMKPFSYVFGWHSYKKDKERDHVTLTSSYSLRVEGLHTLPNMSFSSQVPASPGFTFKNNHHIVPGKTYTPKKKVYIACIQTHCRGLGAWTHPGRGQIPYA